MSRFNIFRVVSLILFILTTTTFKAQKCRYDSLEAEKKKGFLIFSMGSSDPTERLGNQTVGDKNAGLAMTGVSARLSGGYRINKYYGVIGISDVQDFPINIQNIAEYTANQNPGMDVRVESFKGWTMNNLLFGVYGNFPISSDKRFIIEPRALFGLSVASSPELKNTIYFLANGYTKSTYLNQESSVSNMAGVYLLGAGIKYNFCRRLTLTGNVDYCATVNEHEFSGVRLEYNTGDWETRNINMRFSAVNVTVGFGFRFGNN